VGVALGVAEGVAVVVGVVSGGATTAAGVIRLVNDELQVAMDPPPFSELLHWLTVNGSAEVTVEVEATVHRTWLPPPFAVSLH